MLDKALFNDYLSEADQVIDALLADVGQLVDSHRPGQRTDSRATADLINRLFRSMHSFKGLCGMMGLGEVQALAHRFENILDEVRQRRLEPVRSLCEKLLEAVEALSILLAAATKGSSSREEFEQAGKLLDALDGMPRRAETESGSRLKSILLRPSELAQLSGYEESRLVASVREGKS
ncbi:MAG TPA: Hpt domain-containing protein, partial [Blastocatellia bacterium]|nr:Hpt domain-containing protein [Blastocatellia bacterium]